MVVSYSVYFGRFSQKAQVSGVSVLAPWFTRGFEQFRLIPHAFNDWQAGACCTRLTQICDTLLDTTEPTEVEEEISKQPHKTANPQILTNYSTYYTQEIDKTRKENPHVKKVEDNAEDEISDKTLTPKLSNEIKATPGTNSSKENSQHSEVTVQESITMKVNDSTRTKQNTQESNIIQILE